MSCHPFVRFKLLLAFILIAQCALPILSVTPPPDCIGN